MLRRLALVCLAGAAGCGERFIHDACADVRCASGYGCSPVDGACHLIGPLDAGAPGCSPPCPFVAPVCDTSGASPVCRVCTAVEGCSGLAPVCDTGSDGGMGACVTCTATVGCSGTTPRCDLSQSGGKCVGCLSNADCPGASPLCDAVTQTCLRPDAGAPNDDCATAIPLTFADGGVATARGDTTQAGNSNLSTDQSPTCSTSARDTGQDVVYAFSLHSAQDVTVTVAPGAMSYSPVVYVRAPGACASGLARDELSCDSPGAGQSSTTTLADLAPGTYFVWVDGAQASFGPFALTVTLAPPTPPPANDSCASAQALGVSPGQSVTVHGTTRGAAHAAEPFDAGSPSCSFSALVSGPDVMYALALTTAQDVSVSAAPSPGSALEPVVFLRRTCADPSLGNEVACGPGSFELLDLPAGTWSLWVSGAGSSTGDFDLTVSLSGPTPPPPNDTCAQAEPLSLPATGVPGTTWGAHNDTDDLCTGVPPALSGPDVVYSFTTTQLGQFVASVAPQGGQLTPELYLRAPADCTQTAGQGSRGCVCAPNAGAGATLVVPDLPPGDWDLIVDSAGPGGPFLLDARLDPLASPPTNGGCGAAAAVPLSPGPVGTWIGAVNGQTQGSSDGTLLSCGRQSAPDVAYSVTVPTGAAAFNARSLAYSENDDAYVPALSLRTTCAVEIDCEAQSVQGGPGGAQAVALALGLAPGTSLFAVLSSAQAPGQGGVAGPFSASFELAPVPAPNDVCAQAISLPLNTSVTGTTLGASDDYDVAKGDYGGPCAGVASALEEDLSGADVVYAFTAPASKTTTATLVPERGYDGALALLGACAPNQCMRLSDVPIEGAAETIPFDAVAGTTYYLLVDGYAAAHDARGGFTIAVSQ